jgi:glycosyltransferase involved in cell wall biosynthesis
VIPNALFEELRRAVGGDLDAFPRMIAVLVGLTAAVAGYLTGRAPLVAPRQGRLPAFPSEFMKSSVIPLLSHERIRPMEEVILTAGRGRRREPLPNSPKDRIVVVGSGWHFSSGISHYTYRLSTALKEEYSVGALLMRRLVPWRLYPGRQHVGAPVVNVTYPADVPVYDGVDWYWGPSITNALRYLDRQRPTVVVFQWWTGAVLHTYLRLARHAVKLGARIILEWHEGQDVGEITRPGARRYVRTLMPRLLSQVDAHVVHSNFDLRAIKASYPLENAIVHIMPHGPYDHLVQSPTVPVVHNASGPMHLLYLGVVRPFKGVEDLIAAFGALDSDQADKFRLSIVGETWESWNAPEHAIAHNPYANLIERVDRYITDTELAAYFDWADAVVLPYHRSSASGPLQIAMSAGLPVIVTAVGGLIEAVQNYPGALLVPPRDPIALRDALLKVLAYRGRRYPDPHSWRRTIAGYQALIDQLHDPVSRRVASREIDPVR